MPSELNSVVENVDQFDENKKSVSTPKSVKSE